jgi:hypothetical protein
MAGLTVLLIEMARLTTINRDDHMGRIDCTINRDDHMGRIDCTINRDDHMGRIDCTIKLSLSREAIFSLQNRWRN